MPNRQTAAALRIVPELRPRAGAEQLIDDADQLLVGKRYKHAGLAQPLNAAHQSAARPCRAIGPVDAAVREIGALFIGERSAIAAMPRPGCASVASHGHVC